MKYDIINAAASRNINNFTNLVMIQSIFLLIDKNNIAMHGFLNLNSVTFSYLISKIMSKMHTTLY